MVLHPRYHFRRVWEISSDWAKAVGLRALLLDVDNTLTTHDAPHVSKEVTNWLTQMRQAGIALLLLSNNSSERVDAFAQSLALPYIANAKKPMASGVQRACRELGIPASNVAIVGDQLFTDVLCANLSGAVSILVDYMEKEPMPFFRMKRQMEKWVYRPRYTKRQGD